MHTPRPGRAYPGIGFYKMLLIVVGFVLILNVVIWGAVTLRQNLLRPLSQSYSLFHDSEALVALASDLDANELRNLRQVLVTNQNRTDPLSKQQLGQLLRSALLLGFREDQPVAKALPGCLRQLKYERSEYHPGPQIILWAAHRIKGAEAAPLAYEWLSWKCSHGQELETDGRYAFEILNRISLKNGSDAGTSCDRVLAEAKERLDYIQSGSTFVRWRHAMIKMGYNVGDAKSLQELTEAVRFLRDVWDDNPPRQLGEMWNRQGCILETWKMLRERLDGPDEMVPDSPGGEPKVDPTPWEALLWRKRERENRTLP